MLCGLAPLQDVSLVLLVPKLYWDFSLISQPGCLGSNTLYCGSHGWAPPPPNFLLCPFLFLYLSSPAVTTRLLFLSCYFRFCHKAWRQPWVFNTLSPTLHSNIFSHSFPVNTLFYTLIFLPVTPKVSKKCALKKNQLGFRCTFSFLVTTPQANQAAAQDRL